VMPAAVRGVFEGAVGVVPIDGVWRSAAKLLGYGIFGFGRSGCAGNGCQEVLKGTI
jgi:hypothetical protein